MRKILKMPILWIACSTLIVAGCKKEIKKSAIIVPGNETVDGVPTPPLDWENINFMPMPPGSYQVGTPWSTTAGIQYPVEMKHDYHSADGWRLVYNTFNTSIMPDHLMFMLYNVYRGVIRLYYYVPPSSDHPYTHNLIHTLAIEKSYAVNSPMMNFAAQYVVDMATKSQFASAVEEAMLGPGEWYVMQFELAYDKNMGSQNYTTFGWHWTAKAKNFEEIKLNGNIVGQIVGSISVPGTNFTLSPTINSHSNNGNITINGTSSANNLEDGFGTAVVNKVKSALTEGLGGVIKGILKGIFKKQGSTTDENVNLRLNAQIDLTGTATNSLLVAAPQFAIPGYSQSSTVGYEPAYNSAPGVFYLSAKPVVRIQKTNNMTGDLETSTTTCNFTLDNSTYQIDYNPAVTSIASIQNVTREICILNYGTSSLTPVSTNGVYEDIITNTIIANLTTITVPYGQVLPTGSLFPLPIGVRISFDVVPNNGAQPVRIGHTFFATVSN